MYTWAMPASQPASSLMTSMVSFKVDVELHPKGRFVRDSKVGSCFGGRLSHAPHPLSVLSDSANVKYVSVLHSTTIQLIALYSVLAYFWPEVCRGQHYNQCVVVC